MNRTRPNTPFPDVDFALNNNQGTEFASGLSARATTSPITLLPSVASQVGPA
jgi:hypothetical protein